MKQVGKTKTVQSIKNKLFNKHSDLFVQEFIENTLEGNSSCINNGNVYYFSNNLEIFRTFKKDVDILLCETIDVVLKTLGFEKDKDYFLLDNNKIKTTHKAYKKTLSTYCYDHEMMAILKDVLIY